MYNFLLPPDIKGLIIIIATIIIIISIIIIIIIIISSTHRKAPYFLELLPYLMRIIYAGLSYPYNMIRNWTKSNKQIHSCSTLSNDAYKLVPLFEWPHLKVFFENVLGNIFFLRV